ncbi:uncharacterized protein TNCV_4838701 [Trichonephila clavipes]|nr:uncharacterized protein TNCV_4838701 [Trichonephila clavipes]
MCQIEAHEIHHSLVLDCTHVVSRSLEHHAGDSTFWLASTPIMRENTRGGQGSPTSLPLPPTSREGLRLDGYLEYPHAAKALYIYKHLCLLRDSSPVPTVQHSARLTTVPVGRHKLFSSVQFRFCGIWSNKGYMIP